MSIENKNVSLTVSLMQPIPGGWQESIAIVPAPETLLQMQEEKMKINIQQQQEEEQKRKQATERQKKSEGKKRASGLTKDWVPEELVQLAKQLGWAEVVRLARRPSRQWWEFWRASA